MFESVCEVTVAGVQHADPFALAAALAPLTEDAVMTLTADEAECVVAATQRIVNAMAARQAVAVDRYTQHVSEQAANADPGRGDERRVLTDTAAMLAPVLRIAPRTMVSRIEAARWGGCLPRTSTLAWGGDLEPYRVAAITKAAMTLGFDDLVEFEARLFDRDITDLAASRVKDRAVKIAHRLAARHPDPDPVLPRWVRTSGDEHPGCTRWSALLPTDRSARMWAAIDTLAAEYLRANPALSVAEARADAFGDLLLGNAHVTAEVTIVLPADHAPYSQENPLDPDCADCDDTQPDTDEASQQAPGQHQAAGDRGGEQAPGAEAAEGRHGDVGRGDRADHEDREQAADQAPNGHHEAAGDLRLSDDRDGDDRDGDQGPGGDGFACAANGTTPRASAQRSPQNGAALRAAGPEDDAPSWQPTRRQASAAQSPEDSYAPCWPPARPQAGSPAEQDPAVGTDRPRTPAPTAAGIEAAAADPASHGHRPGPTPNQPDGAPAADQADENFSDVNGAEDPPVHAATHGHLASGSHPLRPVPDEPGLGSPPEQADPTGTDEWDADPRSDAAVRVSSDDTPPGPYPWGGSRPPGGHGDEPDGGRPLPAAPSAQDRAAAVRKLVARLKALPPPTPPQPLPRGALPRTAPEVWQQIHWAQHFTWDASELELHVGGQLSHCLRVDVNPYLQRDLSGQHVWFVPGPVAAPGLGCLIPAQLTVILADPDLRIRLAAAHPDTGAVDALDQRAYRPGAALARLVRARDGTCRFPGCNTPASRCHLDHVTRYPDGPTAASNLQSLCAAHHGFKHHATWSVTMTPEGTCTWTAPNGRTHTTYPHAIHDQAA